MTRILVTGVQGQVGQELQQLLMQQQDVDVVGVGRETMDLSQPDSIRKVVQEVQPEVIVNAAAYTAVDKAETEIQLATDVNATAPGILAEEAQKLGARLIHISTDYVFDGKKNTPYLEDDAPNPIGVYGKTKLAGEEAVQKNCDNVIIIRTAWVYGVYGKGNFVKSMLRLGAEREELRVVADQIGSPTWANGIAETISQLISFHPNPGIYHYTNSGIASWYDFAVAIFEEAKSLGFPLKIERIYPITTSEYPTPAQRPHYSVLGCSKISAILGHPPTHWRMNLREMLQQLSLNKT